MSARVYPRGSFKHGCTLAAVTITDAIRFLSQLSLAKDLCCPPSSCRTLLAASVCWTPFLAVATLYDCVWKRAFFLEICRKMLVSAGT